MNGDGLREAVEALADLPRRLREAREFRQASLRDVADECGVSFNTLSRIERSTVDPTLSHALAVARWIAEHPATPDSAACHGCPPCPGRGNDGHGMTHCAECCFGTGVEAIYGCPVHNPPDSAADDTGAGEQEACAQSHDGHPCGVCDGPATPDADDTPPPGKRCHACGTQLLEGWRCPWCDMPPPAQPDAGEA